MKYTYLLFIFFIILSCKKEEVDLSVQQLDVEATRNYVKGEQVYYQITRFSEKLWELKDNDSLKKADFNELSLASFQYDSVNSNKLILDYGTNGFIDKDGVYKYGRISFAFDGKYQEVKSSCVIELFDFVQDTIIVKGKNTLTFLENDTLFSKIEGGELNFSSSQKAFWNSERKRIFVNQDEIFYGKANGTSISGTPYEIIIDKNNPEKIKNTCGENYSIPVEGEIRIDFPTTNLVYRLMNYGNSSCNEEITITIGEVKTKVLLE